MPISFFDSRSVARSAVHPSKASHASVMLLAPLALAASLIFGVDAHAQATQSTPAAAAAAPSPAAANATSGKERSIALSSLSTHVGPIRLRRLDGSASVSVPVSQRDNIKSAVLHLVTTNSISLTARSQLAVRLNGRTVAQLQLSARQPETTADIRLPLELLQAGYNQLSFAVAQHSTDLQCEDPNAPELWTEIDTVASVLRLQTDLKPLTPTLADLSDLIDPKQQMLQKINIVTAGHPSNDEALAAGGLLAQGIGLKMRYTMPTIRQIDAQGGAGGGVAPGLALAPLANADNLLVGTADTLKPYLDAKIVNDIKGSFLGIYPMPDGQHFLMVVSGRDDKEVKRAAEVFAWQRVDLPQQSQWNIAAFTPPAVPPYLPQGNVAAQGIYTFKQLGFNTSTLSTPSPAEVNVNLPPDVYAQEDAQMEFHLNFAQGARINSNVMINLYLNDVFQRSITVEERQGGFYQNYRLSLPLRNFKPGANVLSFRPVAVSENPCAQIGPMPINLFDDSSVKVPYIYRFAQLPDLSRFGSNVFPYVSQSDGGKLSLQVADRDSATIGAAWTLLAKIAQKQTIPLSAAQITYGAPEKGRNIVVVGSAGALPRDLLTDAPWKLDGNLTFAGASIPMATPSKESNWFRQQFQTLAGTNRGNTDSDYLNTSVTGDATLTKQLLVMQFRAAKFGDVTTTVFASATPAQLQDGMNQLVAPQYWNNLAGDVSLLSLGKQDLATQRIGKTYDEGSIGKTEYLGYIASKYPWTWYGLVTLVLAVLALLVLKLLRGYLRRRSSTDGI